MGFNLRSALDPNRPSAERKATVLGLRMAIRDHVRSAKGRMKAHPDFSLRELHDYGRDVFVRLTEADIGMHQAAGFDTREAMRNKIRSEGGGGVNTSVFALVTGNTIIEMVNRNNAEALSENRVKVADQLVQDANLTRKNTDIPEGISQSAYAEVPEGQDYPRRQFSEAYTRIGRKKYGEIMDVTEEMIMDDQVGMVELLTKQFGAEGALEKARYTIEQVIDRNSTVYKPSGSATALYTATARVGGTNKKVSNALANSTNLRNARTLLSAMTNKDPAASAKSKKKTIAAELKLLLVPDLLADLAQQIVGLPLNYSKADGAGAGLENNAVNPYFGRTILTDPILDEVSTSTWYCGDPAKQFIRKIAKPFTVTRLLAGEKEFNADIPLQVKISEMYEVGADDYRFFIQNISAAS